MADFTELVLEADWDHIRFTPIEDGLVIEINSPDPGSNGLQVEIRLDANRTAMLRSWFEMWNLSQGR